MRLTNFEILCAAQMPAPIKLKPIHCEHVAFNFRVKKAETDLQAFYTALGPVLKGKKSLPKRLRFFVPIDASNADSDCHLHLTVEESDEAEHLDLGLDLMTLSRPSVAKSGFPVTVENIGTWLSPFVKGEFAGTAHAFLSYKGPNFRPVIPLPYSGVVPIESSVIRKASIAGLDVEVGESDIGLRRFFMYKPSSDIIRLSIIFGFSHAVNYALFGKLVEKVAAISSVLVIKEKHHDAGVG